MPDRSMNVIRDCVGGVVITRNHNCFSQPGLYKCAVRLSLEYRFIDICVFLIFGRL